MVAVHLLKLGVGNWRQSFIDGLGRYIPSFSVLFISVCADLKTSEASGIPCRQTTYRERSRRSFLLF